MSIWHRLRSALNAPSASSNVADGGSRVSGLPPSSNGASSMHARWLDTPRNVLAVEADLTVLERPESSHLRFWALQASFVDAGVSLGAGHLGLQWITGYPSDTAVNWGGYRAGGGELAGTESSLPSGRNNPHTRNFSWRPGIPYRLTIDRGSHGWRGTVTDLDTGQKTVVRELLGGGTHLDSIVVWSEVFAPCEEQSTAARWSNFVVHVEPVHADRAAEVVRIDTVQLSYQRVEDGGCTNTDTAVAPLGGIVQRTATPRRNPHGAVLQWDDTTAPDTPSSTHP